MSMRLEAGDYRYDWLISPDVNECIDLRENAISAIDAVRRGKSFQNYGEIINWSDDACSNHYFEKAASLSSDKVLGSASNILIGYQPDGLVVLSRDVIGGSAKAPDGYQLYRSECKLSCTEALMNEYQGPIGLQLQRVPVEKLLQRDLSGWVKTLGTLAVETQPTTPKTISRRGLLAIFGLGSRQRA